MDADGEDSPSDVSRLLDKIENENLSLVTAQRGSRNTTFFFKIGYLFFQISGKILTGKTINHGTFSISKRSELSRWVKKDSFYQSFVGGLVSVKTLKGSVVCNRASRRYGTSRLDNSNLILHGLKILISLSPLISARLLVATSAWIIFSAICGTGSIVFKLLGNTTPGWATLIIGFLVQIAMLLIVALLTTLGFVRDTGDSANPAFRLRKS